MIIQHRDAKAVPSFRLDQHLLIVVAVITSIVPFVWITTDVIATSFTV